MAGERSLPETYPVPPNDADVAEAVWPPRVEHNLQVRWHSELDQWALMAWPGRRDEEQPEWDELKVWFSSDDKDEVIAHGATLGAFIAEEWNTDRSCELVIRTKDGRIGKGPSGRRTYGADPETSEG